MQVVASQSATDLIHEQGGRLYVWLKRGRCCGNVTTLATTTSPPPDKELRLVDGADFELYLPSSLTRVPDELHIELRRRPRRIEALLERPRSGSCSYCLANSGSGRRSGLHSCRCRRQVLSLNATTRSARPNHSGAPSDHADR